MATEFRHIVRIVGMDIAGDRKLIPALMGIKGIGHGYASAVIHVSKLDKDIKVGDLSDEQIGKIEGIIKNPSKYGIPNWLLNRNRDFATGDNMHLVTSDLDLRKREDINRLQRIRSYRGSRHRFGLPCRGQRTKASFRKGKAIGVVRRKQQPGQKK